MYARLKHNVIGEGAVRFRCSITRADLGVVGLDFLATLHASQRLAIQTTLSIRELPPPEGWAQPPAIFDIVYDAGYERFETTVHIRFWDKERFLAQRPGVTLASTVLLIATERLAHHRCLPVTLHLAFKDLAASKWHNVRKRPPAQDPRILPREQSA